VVTGSDADGARSSMCIRRTWDGRFGVLVTQQRSPSIAEEGRFAMDARKKRLMIAINVPRAKRIACAPAMQHNWLGKAEQRRRLH
jgi:hypothetical protein